MISTIRCLLTCSPRFTGKMTTLTILFDGHSQSGRRVVRLLLDTNAVLWWEEASPKLGGGTRAVIRASQTVYVSAASAWEAEIKRALGKLTFAGDVGDMITANSFIELPVRVRHATAMRLLEQHHRDPFDRMLVAQALLEECTLVTADRHLARYGVPILNAWS